MRRKTQCSQAADAVTLHRVVSNSWTELEEIMSPDINTNVKVHLDRFSDAIRLIPEDVTVRVF